MHSPLQSPLQPVMRSPLEFRRRGGGSFDIASTNPSAYYDRTNLATLFQDSVGTTPVTAGSQPIGLGLDQSQGLVLGPELVTNGTFDTNINGWVVGTTWPNGSAVWDAGKITVTSNNYQGVYQTISNLVIGRTYKVTVGLATGSPIIYFGINNSPASGPYWYVTSGGSFYFVATATVHTIGLSSDGSSVSTYDTISFKELPGNHQLQATAGKRPIADGTPIYANFDAVDDDLVATFPSSLGAGCTVCRSLPGTGASITTGVTLTATFTDNVDAHALLIYTAAQWAALDAGKIAKITAWLNGRAGL